MTTKVTKESLAVRIKQLELAKSLVSLSLNEEYQLEAYRMLHGLLPDCEHDWDGDYMGGWSARCRKCGKVE